MRGLLVRHVPVRLVNVSISGCLLESSSEISVGITGELRVSLDGNQYHDPVRVSRAVARMGTSSTFHLGGEFSWIDRPGADSVRQAVRGLEADGQPGH